MNRKLAFFITAVMTSALHVEANPMVLIENNNGTLYNTNAISRIDLMDSNNVKIIGRDGNVLLSGINVNDFKLDFNQENINAISDIKENNAPETKIAKKYVEDNRILITTNDGRIFTITGVRIN